MKKIILLLCIVTVSLTACKDSKYSDESEALEGKYAGTFVTVSKTKDATVTISQNKLSPDDLLFNYVIDLTRISEGRYECDGSNSIAASTLSTIITLCGLTNDDFEGTVNKIMVDARFDGSQLKMTITYQTDLGISVNTVFIGTKQ